MNDREYLGLSAAQWAGIGATAISLAPMCVKRFREWINAPSERKMLAAAVENVALGLKEITSAVKEMTQVQRDIADELSINEANVAMMLDASRTAIWFTNAEGECTRANKALCDLFGLSHEDMIGNQGRGWMRAVIPEHRDRVFREFKTALSTDVPYACHYAITKNGKLINVVANGEVIRARDGRVLAVRGTVEPLPIAA